MVKIYGLLTPNVLKPVLVAEELSIHYQHVNVDLARGEQQTPEHLSRNPFGMVPVLEHDGRFLWESGTIMRYLANFTENTLYPTDKWHRAQAEQWLDFANNHVGRNVSGTFFLRCVAGPIFKLPSNETKLKELLANLENEMPILDQHLSKNAYLTGTEITIADLGLFAMTSPYKVAKLDFSKYPHFEAWYQGIRSRPSVERAAKLLPFSYLS